MNIMNSHIFNNYILLLLTLSVHHYYIQIEDQ